MQKIIVIGHVGKEPQEKNTNSGKKVITFSLCIKTGKESVQWYSINLWQDKINLFASILPHIKKGSRLHIIGDLNAPTIYTNKNNESQINMSINPLSISFVNSPHDQQSETKTRREETQSSEEKLSIPTPSWAQNLDLPF